MENKNDKDLQDRKKPTEAPTARADPRQASAASDGPSNGQGTSAEGRRPAANAAELATEVARLAEELQRQKMAFQDIEVSLVTRIADVDDDRRHAASRLQRTLQAHREELEASLKRQASLVTFLLFLVLLIVAGALTFAYYQLSGVHESLRTEMQELRQSLEETKAPRAGSADPLTRKKLSELSEAVDEISLSLERLGDVTEPPSPRAPEKTPAPHSSTANAGSGTEAKETASNTAAPPSETSQAAAAAAPAEKKQEQSARWSDEPAQEPATVEAPAQAEALEPATKAAPSTPTAETPGPPSNQPLAAERRVGDTPFTVQLMGFFSLASMANFIEEHKIPGELYYQTTTYQGRPWFVLIHSMYPTQEAAEAAVADLPEDLAKLDIWIRPLDADKKVTRVSEDGH